MTEMISHPGLESRGQGRCWGQVPKAIQLQAAQGLEPGHQLDRDSAPSTGTQRGDDAEALTGPWIWVICSILEMQGLQFRPLGMLGLQV